MNYHDPFLNFDEPLISTVGIMVHKGVNQPQQFIPIVPKGSSIDFSKYVLRTKSIFFIDLDDPDDFKKFNPETYQFNEKKQFTNVGPIDKFRGRYDNYHLINFADHQQSIYNRADAPNRVKYQLADQEAQYIHYDGYMRIDIFLDLVRYGLEILGRPKNGPDEMNLFYVGLVLECIPFKQKQFNFGKSGGRLTAVNEAADMIDNDPSIKLYMRAMTNRLTFPVNCEVLVVTVNDLRKNASVRTYLDQLNDEGVFRFAGATARFRGHGTTYGDAHKLAFKINNQTAQRVFCDNRDAANQGIIFGHRSYIAELAYHSHEWGRGNGDEGERGTIPHYGQAGGFNLIMLNTNDMKGGIYSDVFLHELGHCFCPGFVSRYKIENPFLSSSRQANGPSTTNNIWADWRGFGDGTPSFFKGGGGEHPNPRSRLKGRIIAPDSKRNFVACPMIYGPPVGGLETIRPMPSTSTMSYTSSKVIAPGELFAGAAYLGAIVDDPTTPPFGVKGEVLSYEAVASIISEYAPDNLLNDRKIFILFNARNAINAYNKTLGTMSYFIRMQILWAGLQSKKSDSQDIQFLNETEVEMSKHLSLWGEDIQYDNFTYSQEKEYKTPYADAEAKANNIDYLKRDPNHNDGDHEAEAEIEDDICTSHVANKFLAKMKFEILEDVIEVINGEPRQTLAGDVAKYHYIVSTAREDEESGLSSSFPHGDSNIDPIIKSVWNGRKIAKQMAIKNAQGEEECKYVYVIVRDASDLNFNDAHLTDDVGETLTIT